MVPQAECEQRGALRRQCEAGAEECYAKGGPPRPNLKGPRERDALRISTDSKLEDDSICITQIPIGRSLLLIYPFDFFSQLRTTGHISRISRAFHGIGCWADRQSKGGLSEYDE
ncbi:hypothetical protein BDN67DRAFT_491543 [Paxillus ammoniavirescens]|nr:hypothetical protein BDN67DRAFT_491543 [Paxillus ammoniavirescens]